MYQAILEICAIISIVGIGIYPLLLKRTKSSMWYVKGCLIIFAVYTISTITTIVLHLN
jgi:hypothetical protein